MCAAGGVESWLPHQRGPDEYEGIMESGIGNFHFEIKYATFTAFGFITDRGEWKLLSCSPDSEWPQQQTRRKGTWKGSGSGTARCYALGTGSDAPSANNQTSIEVFRLTDLDFSALSLLNPQQGFWIKSFYIGGQWADEKHIQKGIVPTPGGPTKLGVPTHGSWNPVISGPLLRAVEIELRAMREEMQQMAIQLGLDIASLVDPSGLLSIPAAGYAMHRGDYLGCCINLLGVIPLFGRLAPAVKFAEKSTRLAGIAPKITFYEKWLEMSTDATRRARQVEGALKVDIQGTTKASMVPMVAKVASEAGATLKNEGWILKIINPANLGFLPEELEVLRKLARDGYYFVIRSCPAVRAKWLRAAVQNGWGIIAKPVWLKIKSLKGAKFEGLVGFLKHDVGFWQTIEHLQLVKEAPASLKLEWLGFKGMSAANVKIYRLTKAFPIPKVEDAEMMLSHYFIDTGDAFVIVDRFGRPYLSDLDVVTIQRMVGRGRFGPPGHNVGPATHLTEFRGTDNAEMSHHWNQVFKGINYPKGYEPFGWHGGYQGSAGFIESLADFEKRTGAAFQVTKDHIPGPLLMGDVRSLGWHPEKRSEDMVVAAHGVEGLGDDVGFVKGWDKLGQFQKANSGMGEYLFKIGQKSH